MSKSSDGSLIFDTELDTSGFTKGSAKLESAVRSLVNQVDKIGNTLQSGFSTSGQVAKFQSQVDGAKDSVERLQEKIDLLGQQTISTVEYENVTKSLEKAEQALFKLYDRRDIMSDMGVSENSKQWQRLQIQIQNAEAELERYESLKASMEASGQAFISGAETDEYRRLSEAVDEATQRLQEYEQVQQQMNDDEAEEKVSRLRAALEKVGSAAKTAAVNIGKMAFGSFTVGIKGAVSWLKQFVSHSNKSALSAKSLLKPLTSLKTLLFSRVKRMFISYIFKDMQESLTLLEKYSSSFGSAMNNMKNSAKTLSANLAVTFGNLITAIEPILTKIINAISRVVTYLNAFFAMLGGKSTMTVAKKQMKDYTKETDKASKSTKDLNKQLRSFDEINRLNAPNDTESNTDDDLKPGDLFEEVPISSILPASVMDFFAQLKKAFEEGDYDAVGAILAGKLNEMVQRAKETVKWENVGEKITSVVNAIVGIVNSLSHNINFYEIGALFGELANTIINTVDLLLTGIDWKSLGSNIAQGLYGIIATVDWGKVGSTLSHAMTVFPKMIIGAIQGINWRELAATLLNGLMAFIRGVDWADLASTLFELIGSALGGLAAFLAGLIETAWKAVVDWWHGIAYEDGKFTMEGLLNGILDGLANLGAWIVENIFTPFINGFKKAFGIASPSKVMAEQGEYITGGLLKGITDSWGPITDFFSSAVSGIENALSNGWSTIKSAASSAWEYVKSEVTGKFTATREKLESGVSGVSASMSSGWSSVKDSASSLWEATRGSVTSIFASMQSQIGGSMSTLMSTVSGGWNSIQSTATTMWASISGAVMAKWNGLRSTMRGTDWASIGSGICSGIRAGINAGWSWLTSTVSDLANSLLNKAKSALGIHSPSRVFRDEVGKNVGLGVAEGISDTQRDVATTVSNLAKTAVDAFGNPTLSADVASVEMISGLDMVAEKLSAIVGSFHAIASVLEAMGGLLTPDIAVGTVIPPKVRTAAVEQSSGAGTNPAGDDWADRVISALVQVGEAIIKSIDEKDTSVSIGDEDIWDANNRYKNKMDMIRGTV